MTSETRTPRRASRAIALALAVGLAASIAGALPAAAHTQVSPASPEPGSTVTTGPVTVALNTTEPILESGQKSIVVKGPGDEERYYGDGCTEVSNGMTLSSDVELGEPGEYTVIWTLVAEDGHTQSSNDFEPFTFTWQPDEGQSTVEGSATVPTCGEQPPADAGKSSTPAESDGSNDSPETSESSEQAPDASQGDADNADSVDDSDSADDSDIGWLIAAAGIIFIAAAAIVMIAVRRRMLADDEETTDAEDPGSPDEPGSAGTQEDANGSPGEGPPSTS